MSGNTVPTNVVIRINDREVTNSFKGINAEVRKLERELKGTTAGTEEFYEKLKELENAQRELAGLREEIERNKRSIRESSKEIKSFSDMWAYMSNSAVEGIDVTNISVKGLGAGIKTMAAQSWAAISSIPIVGWIAAAVGALAIGMKEVLDYNVELQKANKLTESITKLQNEALDKITQRSMGFEDVFGFDRQKTLEAARNIVEKFGITYDQAMDLIEDGAIKGGVANDEFLDSMREYPVFFAKAGFSAKEFVSIINAGFDLGVYSDKLPDAIKEFDLSMREQTKSTREALVNAFGATFSDDLLQRVSHGKTTVKEALIEINKESTKYNLTQQQQAQITADIFRGAGEDVGGFAIIMDAVTLSMIEQNEVLTDGQQYLKDQIDNYNNLEQAKNDALNSEAILAFKRDVENAWNGIKVLWYNILVILRGSVNGIRVMIGTTLDYLALIPATISSTYAALKKDFANIGSIALSFARVIRDALTLNWDQIDSSYEKFTQSLKTGFKNTIDTAKKVKKAIEEIPMDNYYEIKNSEKAKAEAQKTLEKMKDKAAKTAAEKTTTEKAAAEKARKEREVANKRAQSEAEKLRKERLKDLEESLKAESEANNRSIEAEIQWRVDKLKLQEDSLKKESSLADLERSKELNSQRKQQDEILNNIAELEDKKANAKSPESKFNYDEALKKERALLNTHDQIVLTTEDTHQLKLKTIREKWRSKELEEGIKADQRRIDNTRRAREEEIINITSLETAKAQLLAQSDLKLTSEELRAIDNLEDAKAALREAANRAMLKQQEDAIILQLSLLSAALQDPTLTKESREKLSENLEFLKDKITQIRSAIDGGNTSDAKKVIEEQNNAKSQVDILGFSALDWENSFKNLDTTEGKIKALGMAFQALGNAGQMFSQLIQSQNEKELRHFTKIQESKRKSLLKELNEGYLTQEEYTLATQKLQVEAANKKAELDYKAAQAEKISRVFSAVGATALAVATALTAGPIAGPILATIVGALGAVQVGIITSQPLPERPSFAGGGFTGNGFGFPDDTGYKPAGIVHENEWVAPEWMLAEPRIAKVIEYLESVRTGSTKPMADGGFSTTANSPIMLANDNSQDNSELNALMADVRELLQFLKDNGVEAWMVDSAENGKKIKRTIKKFEDIENKASRK